MKNIIAPAIIFTSMLLSVLSPTDAAEKIKTYPIEPPFTLDLLGPARPATGGESGVVRNPKNQYNIFIFYELGMHCAGFDVSYCCVIPPYNSVQAQAVRSGEDGGLPGLLSPSDGVMLDYRIRDNTYSEGNKMKFWHVPKDVTGNGTMSDPDDNMANYVWKHLFIYKDLEGTLPEKPSTAARKHIGLEIPVNIDSGPSGKPLAGGRLDYAGDNGGNIVFADSLAPWLINVPLKLTASHLWDALGLPMTAFNDSRRKGSLRTVTDFDFQPYQYGEVELRDVKGRPVAAGGGKVVFFGTEPVDIATCSLCHSGEGRAAKLSRQQGLTRFDEEYRYWKKNYPDESEYMARLSTAPIDILELHDRNFKTSFLKEYDSSAASNRLGSVGSVNCADCHGQNITGNLRAPRPGATGYAAVRARPLGEAVHSLHMRTVPMPDKAGRTQNCQTCHPSHWQEKRMNDIATNPYHVTDADGNPRFTNADVKTGGGGCYLRRDAHSNPDVKPPFFLNGIGRWMLANVSMKDATEKAVKEKRGLYCTNCHNHLAHELYRGDDLLDATAQSGKTLRNRTIGEIISAVAGGNEKKFKSYYADPVVGAAGNPLHSFYAAPKGTVLLRYLKTSDGGMVTFPWNSGRGDKMLYSEASAGNTGWLSPGEPHCADCHIAPFVESAGGQYFPIDQPGKYSLFRYSKAHGDLACQSCHESTHGLYPVRHDGPVKTVDLTSREQALQFSPDGKYAGPVTCAACHTVNGKGIPVQLKGTGYYGDYWASVVLIHFMREGDQKLPIGELMRKYPPARSGAIVVEGWK